MPNILINTNCNRSCPYCFASKELNAETDSSMYMSLDTVKKTIAYLKDSGEKRFSIIGGEPSLHPDLEKIIELVLAEDMSMNMFTNGVMSARTAELLAAIPKDKLALLVNVNDLDSYTEAERNSLFNALSKFGERCNLGYNIHTPEFDFTFLAELVNRFSLSPVIRVGIASPIFGGENMHISASIFPEIGSKIVEQAAVCDEQDVVIGFDCGFTLCMFTDDEIGRLYKYGTQLDFYCQPVIDVGLDHQVWTCFPLSDWKRVHLDDFKNINEIKEHYDKEMHIYHQSGVYNECVKCKHKKRGRCSGGCVARVLHSFK